MEKPLDTLARSYYLGKLRRSEAARRSLAGRYRLFIAYRRMALCRVFFGVPTRRNNMQDVSPNSPMGSYILTHLEPAPQTPASPPISIDDDHPDFHHVDADGIVLPED